MKAKQTYSDLTDQEIEASRKAHYDLGPGYPQFYPHTNLFDNYLDPGINEQSLHFSSNWSTSKQAELDIRLRQTASEFLQLGLARSQDLRWTFSGSVALDRCLSAIQRISRKQSRTQISVITTTPCIDIMKMFLLERIEVKPHFVQSNCSGVFGNLDVDCLLAKLYEVAILNPGDCIVVLLSSPENPTGEIWTELQLQQICEGCISVGAFMLIDHCFLKVGIQSSCDVHPLWAIPTAFNDWIAVWDTGKTFGFNEDKLGFIIPGNKNMLEALDESLSVIQFDVARRSKILFSNLFQDESLEEYLNSLREICRANYINLQSSIKPPTTVRTLVGGSLALLDVSNLGSSARACRKLLLDNGVGVISGDVFFHTEWMPRQFIRLALARDMDYFQDGIRTLIKVLN